VKYLWFSLLLPVMAIAETFTVNYTEPSGTGFAKVCAYACIQYNSSVCTCTPAAITACQDNLNGATAEATSVSWDIPIKDGQLPTCINYGVRSIDSSGNASALVTAATGDHVFDAP
jgi:hypothetical protein